MKISPLQNISFQKKLVAKCGIIASGKQLACGIYNLEKGDEKYFENLLKNPEWMGNEYITIVDSDAKRGDIGNLYVLENCNNNCLGYMEILNGRKEDNILDFIEVKPVCRHKNDKRTKKYIGETLLNYLVQKTKTDGKKYAYVPFVMSNAREFYKQCGFTIKCDRGLKMRTDKSKDLEEQNFEHTGVRMEIIA